MEFIQTRVEPWIKGQRDKILKLSWGPLQWRMKWPPWNDDRGEREQRMKIQQEYDRKKKQQLQDLCLALKADSISDLQDILCCMVLSECVYKRPANELIRAVNKFKADFGGEIVSLERVQPSSDHVPHRYLLAEAGDTLFASFIGTKQYRDVMADAYILQGAIFHEDKADEIDNFETPLSDQDKGQKVEGSSSWNPLGSRSKPSRNISKPAVHRGFMARAKGIPALELYRLAVKKKRKLVLCGHSLGGAVAALATLAILRVVAAASFSKENEKVPVRCITFSQPPVGNAALKEYVNRKGWQHYFKSYCIPEDLVPRILSPAYFHHYNAQPPLEPPDAKGKNSSSLKPEEGLQQGYQEGEQLVLGLGPVQKSFWRLSRLVPLEGLMHKFKRNQEQGVNCVDASMSSTISTTLTEEEVVEPQSLEIEEGSDGISLKPLSTINNDSPAITVNGKVYSTRDGTQKWSRVPYLPSYVPFGQLYLLGNSSVELLSGAEYSKLTSVKSVIAELKERFQSHSMRSYRSRFQRINELCMNDNATSFLGIDQGQQFPHLQQWLGISAGGTVELGHIVESPVIHAATSIVPLGWSGLTGRKNRDPLKVDITGFGLHLCNLVHAQVDGQWCSTTVESFPSAPAHSPKYEVQPELQKMRILIGTPLKKAPTHEMVVDTLMPLLQPIGSDGNPATVNCVLESNDVQKFIRPANLNNFVIFCTSDFTTVVKEVHVRTRRVRLIGLEGAGKSTLLQAILTTDKTSSGGNNDNLIGNTEVQEGIAGGLLYYDSPGVNLQDLKMAVSRFRDDLWSGIRDLSQKTDLIVLVHNLSHSIPRYWNSNSPEQKPALSLLLDEAKSLGIPWILAITNKFSVSAQNQKAAVTAAMQAYQASLSTTGVSNSCPYVMPTVTGTSLPWGAISADSDRRNVIAQSIMRAPVDFVRRPFQKKEIVLPEEGVHSLCHIIHCALRSHEEASFQELARERLITELARERASAIDATKDAQAKAKSLSAAAVGASLGAGIGIVMAVVMGAASALRKP